MELVQSRIVTDDVQRLAAFYARLVASTTAAGLAGEAVHRQVVAGVLGSGLGQGLRGAGGVDDRAGPGGPGGWLVVVGEQDGREPGLHVPGAVVRDHAQEHVGADAVFGAVPDGPDVQIGTEGHEARFTWARALWEDTTSPLPRDGSERKPWRGL